MIQRALILLTLLFASVAVAQPMADRVPSDAVVYIGWQGSDSVGSGYEKSHLKGVIDSSNIPQVFSEFLPRLIERLGKDDAQAAAVFRSIHGIGRIFWPRPAAIYFGGIDMNAPAPMPRLAMICDAGAEAAATLDSLNPIVENLNRAGVPLVAAVHGRRFVTISVGGDISAAFAGLLGDPADKSVPPLSSRKDFSDAMGQVQKQPVLALFVDAGSVLKLFDQIAAGDGEQHAKEWANVRDAIGLAGLKVIVCTGGFEGPDWSTQAFISAPAPRAGMLAMLDSRPLSDDIFKAIPKSASYVAAFRFDVAKAFEAFRTVLGDLDPAVQQMFDQGTAAISAMTAVNFKTQFLESIGDQWAIYGDANVGGNGMLGFVLMNRPSDAKKLEESLDKIDMAAGNIISGQTRNDGMTVMMRETKIDGMKVRYWAIPLFSPSWTIKDGNIYAALQPQIAASAAAAGGKGTSILDNPAFAAARKRLGKDGGAGAGSMSYVDLQETITSSYATTLALTRMGLGFADIFGVEAPPIVIPPLDKLHAHLGTAAAAAWTDDAGWHSRSISPFPGSEIFATEANMILAQQALALSIMLPAMNQGRERANRVKCASNMRQMGQGVLLYANDHKGKYPEMLGDLVEADLNWQVFVCPDVNTQPPPPDVQRDPKKRAAWINQNASYVYLGGNMNGNLPADRILMYEKENHGPQGLNVLFNDGHVEWMDFVNFNRDLQQQVPPPAKK